MGDDRRPDCGRASLSPGVPQLCVCRKPTPSRRSRGRLWLRLTAMPASWAACASALRLHWAEPCSSRATIVPSSCLTSCPGGAWRTCAMILLSSATVSRRLRPDLGRAPRPSIPSASKRCSRRRTVLALQYRALAIASPRCPSRASHYQAYRLDPFRWPVPTCRHFADPSFFLLILRCSLSQNLRHLLAPSLFYHHLTNAALD